MIKEKQNKIIHTINIFLASIHMFISISVIFILHRNSYFNNNFFSKFPQYIKLFYSLVFTYYIIAISFYITGIVFCFSKKVSNQNLKVKPGIFYSLGIIFPIFSAIAAVMALRVKFRTEKIENKRFMDKNKDKWNIDIKAPEL